MEKVKKQLDVLIAKPEKSREKDFEQKKQEATDRYNEAKEKFEKETNNLKNEIQSILHQRYAFIDSFFKQVFILILFFSRAFYSKIGKKLSFLEMKYYSSIIVVVLLMHLILLWQTQRIPTVKPIPKQKKKNSNFILC